MKRITSNKVTLKHETMGSQSYKNSILAFRAYQRLSHRIVSIIHARYGVLTPFELKEFAILESQEAEHNKQQGI